MPGSPPRRRPARCRPSANPDGFRLLHGCELEIRADGRLDYDDDLLARFDLVVASRPRRPAPAARRPHAPHPQRDPQPARRRRRPPVGPDDQTRDDLDLHLDAVFAGGRRDRHGARDQRLAPPPRPRAGARASRALEWAACCRSTRTPIGPRELEYAAGGPDQARRAWVEPKDVLNTRPLADLLAWVAGEARSRLPGVTPGARGPSARMTTPDAAADPVAALARRELVAVAVVLVVLTRAVRALGRVPGRWAAAGGPRAPVSACSTSTPAARVRSKR